MADPATHRLVAHQPAPPPRPPVETYLGRLLRAGGSCSSTTTSCPASPAPPRSSPLTSAGKSRRPAAGDNHRWAVLRTGSGPGHPASRLPRQLLTSRSVVRPYPRGMAARGKPTPEDAATARQLLLDAGTRRKRTAHWAGRHTRTRHRLPALLRTPAGTRPCQQRRGHRRWRHRQQRRRDALHDRA